MIKKIIVTVVKSIIILMLFLASIALFLRAVNYGIDESILVFVIEFGLSFASFMFGAKICIDMEEEYNERH